MDFVEFLSEMFFSSPIYICELNGQKAKMDVCMKAELTITWSHTDILANSSGRVKYYK